MKQFIFYLTIFFMISIYNVNGNCENNDKTLQSTSIAFLIPQGNSTSIQSFNFVTDEWKSPGTYSPVNLFDGNPATCYAVTYNDNKFEFFMKFTTSINVDELRIINGFAKNKTLFLQNNRVKNFTITFINDNKSQEENVILADKINIQIIKLKKTYNADEILFINSIDIYRGSKFNDTCISEIEFYYKGNKVNITNSDELKKEYLDSIQADITKLLSNRFYVLFLRYDNIEDRLSSIKSEKNGNLLHSDCRDTKFFSADNFKYLPDKWKVKNSMLYLRINGKWVLQKYKIYRGFNKTPIGLYLFTMPFEGFPSDAYFDVNSGDE